MDAEDEVDRLFGKIELQLDQAKQKLAELGEKPQPMPVNRKDTEECCKK
ncbi:MAG: hypothetical protein U5L45_14405 [Saprospiraceae bacterium]|nr:hypothetical protein [Saprospiraceae bacterium]